MLVRHEAPVARSGKGDEMRTLLVLGFPYATSANAAGEDVLLQDSDLTSEPGAVAVVSRDDEGAFQLTTRHTLGEDGRPFLWQLLLTALIFLPGSGSLAEEELKALCQRLEALGLSATLQDRVRGMLAPNTSALLVLTTEPVSADALTALGRFGATLLAASLPPDFEVQLMHALHETAGFAMERTDHPADG
jgi:uncharacterized membrane protein